MKIDIPEGYLKSEIIELLTATNIHGTINGNKRMKTVLKIPEHIAEQIAQGLIDFMKVYQEESEKQIVHKDDCLAIRREWKVKSPCTCGAEKKARGEW